jgi:hypothetical protein
MEIIVRAAFHLPTQVIGQFRQLPRLMCGILDFEVENEGCDSKHSKKQDQNSEDNKLERAPHHGVIRNKNATLQL